MTVLADPWLRMWAAPTIRAVLLVISVLLGFVFYQAFAAQEQTAGAPPVTVSWSLTQLVTATLVLGVSSTLASVRPRTRAQAVAQPLVEAAVVGVVLVTVAFDLAVLYVGFLFIAVFVAGQRSGLPGALAASAIGALPWSVRSLQDLTLGEWQEADSVVTILGALVTVSLLSAWIRRLRLEREVSDDSAYSDAFRLLSELQHVARNLSLGLDPATLAAALAEDVSHEAPGVRTAVAVRGPEGRFSPLIGALDDVDHALASEAWLSGAPTAGGSVGDPRRAVPVTMGDRVMAVATLSGSRVDDALGERIDEVVGRAGPRLGAALLFDEVRRLATTDERLRLAREIHDGIAQELASIGYVLDDLTGRVPPDAAADLRMLRDHVRKVTGELRLSIFDLRAGVDETVTLGAALAEHGQRVAAASRLVAHTSIDEQGDRLSPGTEIELLRIAQEALTNVRKHARASTVWIDCTVDAPSAFLRVSDDGVGLQPSRPGAMGLRGMRERARRIGGELHVAPRDGGGTVVEVRLGRPLATTSGSSRPAGVARTESIA